ncbi:MAG: hypothetical protein K1X75_15955 [Leptospirales bacterium]|nr:hypothetical protein [Leptospirales bacterium]
MHDLRLYAHRGASRLLPENTIAAFQQALQDGATHLELDVHLSRDGKVVVAHDRDGLRMAGQAALICESAATEIVRWNMGARFQPHAQASDRTRFDPGRKYPPPLLDEVLANFPEAPLNVDIKQHDGAATRAVLELLERSNAAARTHLTSFSGEVLQRVRAAGFQGGSGVRNPDLLRLLFLPRWWPADYRGRGDAVQLPRRRGRWVFDRARFIERVHRAGLRIDYWVVNEPQEAELLFGRGADGVMSDDPARMGSVFQAARLTRNASGASSA